MAFCTQLLQDLIQSRQDIVFFFLEMLILNAAFSDVDWPLWIFLGKNAGRLITGIRAAAESTCNLIRCYNHYFAKGVFKVTFLVNKFCCVWEEAYGALQRTSFSAGFLDFTVCCPLPFCPKTLMKLVLPLHIYWRDLKHEHSFPHYCLRVVYMFK